MGQPQGRGWGRSVGLAMLVALLCASNPLRAEPFRLIITDLTTPLVPNSILDLADRLGYFKREGVDVQLVRVQQTPLALAALKAGEGDMANVGADAALQMIARGMISAKVVDSPARSLSYMVVGRSDIASLADLKGRAFGVGRIGSTDQSLTSKVLDASGVPAKTVDFVPIGQPAARAQALVAGRIDATTVSAGIWTTLPDRTGLHVLVPPERFYAAAPILTKVDIVPDSVLAAKRDQVTSVVRALVKASRDFADKPSLWVDAVAAVRTDVRREDLQALADALRHDWSVNGGLDRGDLDDTADWLFKTRDFDGLARPDRSAWADLSILRDVLRQVGPAAGTRSPTLD